MNLPSIHICLRTTRTCAATRRGPPLIAENDTAVAHIRLLHDRVLQGPINQVSWVGGWSTEEFFFSFLSCLVKASKRAFSHHSLLFLRRDVAAVEEGLSSFPSIGPAPNPSPVLSAGCRRRQSRTNPGFMEGCVSCGFLPPFSHALVPASFL